MAGVLYLIGLISVVWIIYDVWVLNTRIDETTKILWTFIALFANVLAAIIYGFIYKKPLSRRHRPD